MSGEQDNPFSISNSRINRSGINVVVEDVVDTAGAQTNQVEGNGRNQPASELRKLRRYPDTVRLTRFPTQLHKMYPLTASTNSLDTETDVSIIQLDMDHQYLHDMCTKKSIYEKAKISACCGSDKSRCRLVTNRVQPLENVNQKNLSIRQHTHWDEHTLFSQLQFDDQDSLIEAVTRAPSVVTLRDSHGQTLLHHAASKGNVKIAKFLISHKSKINEMDEQGNLPIHAAVKEGHAQITKYLLMVGADALHANKDGLQPIHIVCERNDVSTLKVLLQVQDLDVNAEGERGATPLHYCCLRDSVDCLLLLLSYGANIYMRDFEKTYPIHVAIANVSHQCVKALFEHEEQYYSHKLEQTRIEDGLRVPSIPSSRFSSISETCNTRSSTVSSKIDKKRRVSKTQRKLEHLAQSLRRYSQQNIDEEQCMITLTDCEGETPLHAAVTSGSTEMVKICLNRNAKILAKQNDENTPVHYACIKDDLECVQLLFNAKPELRSTVLRMPNKNGYTPLHLAAVYNHEKMICYLVEQGSPLEMTDRNGWTPLLLAAMKGAFQACVQLLRLGANPNAHDLTNRNLVHLLMLFRGPGVRTVLPEMNNNELFKRLVNEKDNYGSTPLHYSTQMGNLGATQAFLLQGASALERDNERNTPLHTAAYFGRLHTCERLLDTGHGMRAMNSPDALGRLPLHVAVEQGHVNVVKLFLEKGCVFRKCHLGNTPLHYVAIGGCVKTCRILLQTNPSLLNQVNFHGMTALHYAARENRAQVLDHLLTSKAAIVPDKGGLYFVTYALQRRNHEAMKVIITHLRWHDIHKLLDNTSQCPVDGLIKDMPSLCMLVLDRCIKVLGSENTMDHEVLYDFTILQRPVEPNEPLPKDPMRRIKLMVELQRKELLTHPLCTAYLQRKWQTYGKWIQLCVTMYYAILLAAITSLVLSHSPIRHVETLDKLIPCADLFHRTPLHLLVFSTMASVVLILTGLDLVIKMWQLITQRLEYFKDWNNYLEFVLSALAMTYSALGLAGHLDHHHVGLGVFVMFLAWFNFLLQMMRYNHVGIFVVMFLDVFATVGKCLIVFSVVFIAFALSFHVLFRVPQHRDILALSMEEREQANFCFSAHQEFTSMLQSNETTDEVAMELQSFQYIGLSMFKTLMMMLGEYEHTATLIAPLTGNSPVSVHYPAITLFFYVAFVFLVPIIMMNLLIGLAVGDIEQVRQTAVQRLISQQVYWLADLEPKLMFIFRSKVYNHSWKRKWRKDRTIDTPSEGTTELETFQDETLRSDLKEALHIVSGIEQQLQIQSTRTAAIIDKLDIKTKEYTLDEGTFPGVILGEDGIDTDIVAIN